MFNAISMYSQIDTNDCIERLTMGLLNPMNQKKYEYPAKALIEAIKLIMKNNIMNFRDMIVNPFLTKRALSARFAGKRATRQPGIRFCQSKGYIT